MTARVKNALFFFCDLALFIVFIFTYSSFASSLRKKILDPLSLKNQHIVQDVIINNMIIASGTEQNRYKYVYNLVQQLLECYRRPFTVVDIGACAGYFSFKIAAEYSATCVLWEDGRADRPSRKQASNILPRLCELNHKLNSLVLLSAPITCYNLNKFAECEHVDVVLVSDILEYADKHWKKATDQLLAIGEHTFIQVPAHKVTQDDFIEQINKYLIDKGARVIGSIAASDKAKKYNIYLFYSKKNSIKRTCWRDNSPLPAHIIESDFKKKVLKSGDSQREWLTGINLLTFNALNGIYPSKVLLQDKLEKVSCKVPKGSVVLIQGNNLAAIPQSYRSGANPFG